MANKKPRSANHNDYFILVTGVPLKNLKELASSLETMNDWVFNHHVNYARNDFSNWARDVLKEKELSEEIRTVSKNDMEKHILRHLVNQYL